MRTARPAAYVGEWRSKTMALLLTQDGTVAYKRLKGGVTISLNGPLRRFEGGNFDAVELTRVE